MLFAFALGFGLVGDALRVFRAALDALIRWLQSLFRN